MRIHSFAFGLVAAAAAITAGMPATRAADVTLKAGTFLPSVDRAWYPIIKAWIDDVNKRGKDQGIQVRMVAAGFKAMNPFEMGNAVKSGVLDVVHLAGTFYNKIIPISDAQKLSTVTVQEQRTNGAFAFLRPIYAKNMNVYYLGRWGDGVKFHFYLNKPMTKADLTGFKIRGTSVYQSFIEKLGGTMITTPPSEAYTAVERGIVDGLGWPLWGIHAWGWQKILKYRIEPGFYTADLSILVNLDTWNKLNKAQQQVLHDATVKLENDFIKIRDAKDASERARQLKDGVKPLTLPPAEAAKYLKVATEAGWADVIKKDPVNGPKIRELTTK